MGEARAQLCTACRKLVSAGESVCPYCGAWNPTLWGYGDRVRRYLGGSFDAVNGIMAVSILMLVVCIVRDPVAAFRGGGMWSLGSPGSSSLYLFGMTGGPAWTCGFWWTLLTATFLHGGPLHLLFNMMWLRSLGPLAIELIGSAKFFVVYVMTGVGGFLVSNLWHNAPTIGASCAILGLMGLLMALGKRRGGTFGRNLNQQLMGWAAISLLLGFMVPMINNAGHIGGFVTGYGLGYLLPVHRTNQPSRSAPVLALGIGLLTICGFVVSVWRMWGPVVHGGPVCLG